jgi:hypothetical protein
MAAGADDAKILLQPYLTPAVNAFGAGLSGGWYNTAEPHKPGGFDITFTLNTGIAPQSQEKFIIDESELTFLKLQDPTNNMAPTVVGPDSSGAGLAYNFEGFSGNAFYMPPGVDVNFVPSPMVQAGIGLVKGTELMARYLPDIVVRENEIGLWGLGGKHDIKQWIPGLKHMPVFQMSVMYGYTRLHTIINLDVTPGHINAGALPGANDSDWKNQQLKLLVESHTANMVISANLPVVCFYGSVGFVTTKTNLSLRGEFPSVYLDDTTPSVKVLTDPINMEITNKEGSLTKPRFNAGVRLKLAVVTITADYSWANYSVLTAGLGFSFR